MSLKDSPKAAATNWERLTTMSDDEVDLSDIPALDISFFETAELRLRDGVTLGDSVESQLQR